MTMTKKDGAQLNGRDRERKSARETQRAEEQEREETEIDKLQGKLSEMKKKILSI